MNSNLRHGPLIMHHVRNMAGALVVTISGPAGLAFESAGNLYVANNWIGVVSKATTNGEASIFSKRIREPAGLASDGTGEFRLDVVAT